MIWGCMISVGCTIDNFVPFRKSKVGKGRDHSMYFTTFSSVKLNFLRTVYILYTYLRSSKEVITSGAAVRYTLSEVHLVQYQKMFCFLLSR